MKLTGVIMSLIAAAVLSAGDFPLQELFEKICTATWQYARRQRTWFRHQHPEAEIFSGNADLLFAGFISFRSGTGT